MSTDNGEIDMVRSAIGERLDRIYSTAKSAEVPEWVQDQIDRDYQELATIFSESEIFTATDED